MMMMMIIAVLSGKRIIHQHGSGASWYWCLDQQFSFSLIQKKKKRKRLHTAHTSQIYSLVVRLNTSEREQKKKERNKIIRVSLSCQLCVCTTRDRHIRKRKSEQPVQSYNMYIYHPNNNASDFSPLIHSLPHYHSYAYTRKKKKKKKRHSRGGEKWGASRFDYFFIIK